MQEKIKEIYDKIKLVLSEEHERFTKYLVSEHDLSTLPRPLHKEFTTLMPWCKGIYSSKELIHILNKADEEALKYNKSEVLINRNNSIIEIWYYETEQEIYDRLSKKYDSLVNEIKKRKEAEYQAYLNFKSVYEK